ncbi:hypothetical protein HDU76_007099, partial [Blyttiomyces sp. JEL0837]
VFDRFRLDALLDLPLSRLSNGQLRRLRLSSMPTKARVIYVVINNVVGLDVTSRRDIASILHDLKSSPSFPNVLLLLRPQDDIPDWITHVGVLDNQSLIWQGTHEQHAIIKQAEHKKTAKTPPKRVTTPTQSQRETLQPIVRLSNVTTITALDKANLLQNVSWTIYPGDRWHLAGPNGSGKTTLLSLLVGDHPQAFSNTVILFGNQRGSGESIWDIKSNVGMVSPEFHMLFAARAVKPIEQGSDSFDSRNPRFMTVLEAVVSGFRGAMIPPACGARVSSDEIVKAKEFLKEWGWVDKPYLLVGSHLPQRENNSARSIYTPFRSLSMGEQRFVLIIRALVASPRLIVLDEPFQGLDEEMVQKVHGWLERRLKDDQALVVVTHHDEEVPNIVGRRLRLENGTVVEESIIS